MTNDNYDFDLVVWDTIGGAYTSKSVAEAAAGGSEKEVVQLAEGLAAKGYKVLCVNGDSHEPIAFLSSPLTWAGREDVRDLAQETKRALRCRTLLIQRYSGIPGPHAIVADRMVVRATDVYGDYHSHLAAVDHLCVSEWQAAEFRKHGFFCRVIPPMLDDDYYELAGTPKVKGQFLFASAWMKGLPDTLDKWLDLRERFPAEMKLCRLRVTSPGYGKASNVSRTDSSITYLDDLAPRDLAQEMAHCEGLFYVNTFPETFGAVASIMDAVGGVVFALEKNGKAGLQEASAYGSYGPDLERLFDEDFIEFLKIPEHRGALAEEEPRDLRVSTILPQWEAALRLKTEKRPHASEEKRVGVVIKGYELSPAAEKALEEGLESARRDEISEYRPLRPGVVTTNLQEALKARVPPIPDGEMTSERVEHFRKNLEKDLGRPLFPVETRAEGRLAVIPNFSKDTTPIDDRSQAVGVDELYDFLDHEMPVAWWRHHREKLETGGIDYLFHRADDNHYKTCGCPLCSAFAYVKSRSFQKNVEAVFPDLGELETALVFGSYYASGDYLAGHNDAGNGDIAFVWNLTRGYAEGHGGELVLGDSDGVQGERWVPPEFNTLVLFTVPQWHRVEESKVDSPKRLAISGWLRRKTPKARLDPEGTAQGKTILTGLAEVSGKDGATVVPRPGEFHVDTETGKRTPLTARAERLARRLGPGGHLATTAEGDQAVQRSLGATMTKEEAREIVAETRKTIAEKKEPRVCLVMLIKPGTHPEFVKRALSSVRGFVDMTVIGFDDQGSHFAFAKMIDSAIGGGWTRVLEPWVNFSHNRNVLARYAEDLFMPLRHPGDVSEKADYILTCDVDDEFVGLQDFDKTQLVLDAYEVEIHDGTDRYPRLMLWKTNRGFHYELPAHEFLTSEQSTVHGKLPGVHYLRHPTPLTVDQRRKKYLRDVQLFTAELKKKPSDTRCMYYLAQSLHDASCGVDQKLLREAVEAYLERGKMGGYFEERFLATMRVGILLRQLKTGTPEEIAAAFKTAADIHPARAPEARFQAVHYFNNEGGSKEKAVKMAGDWALPINLTPPVGFLVDVSIYQWQYAFQLAIALCYTGRQKEAKVIFEDLLRKAPPEQHAVIKSNLTFCEPAYECNRALLDRLEKDYG
jgi:hypothetical protein